MELEHNKNHPDFLLKSKEINADMLIIENPWTERLV